MLFTLILLGVSTSADSLASMDESQYGDSEFVDPVLIHSAHIRRERSATHMPDVLHFRFELSGTEVSLNLTQSERDVESYPVYLTGEHGTVLQTELLQHTNAAVYRNSAQGSAAIVTRKAEDVYQLAGTIHVNNQTYKISPKKHHVDKRQATNGNQHELREIVAFNLSNDTAGLLSEFPSLGQAIPSNVQSTASNVEGMSNDTAHYTIELALFPDYSDYSGFLRDAEGNTTVTISNMRLYYAFVEEMMQTRYDTVKEQDPSISITVWIKYINIATSTAGSPWTETMRNGSVVPAIRALSYHAQYLFVNAPRSADAYMIFTRYALTNPNPVIGVAAIDALCTDIPVSITMNFPDGIVGLIVAHELGHILGLNHDSDSGCNNTDLFVMTSTLNFPSPLTPSNPWTFSPCSVATLKTSLSAPVKACALNTSISSSTLSTNGQRTGQTTNGDQQCAARFRSDFRFSRSLTVTEMAPQRQRRRLTVEELSRCLKVRQQNVTLPAPLVRVKALFAGLAFGIGIKLMVQLRNNMPIVEHIPSARNSPDYGNGTNFDSMCQTMCCSPAGFACIYRSIPLEQTSCGDKKWCERGVCVSNAAAPPRSAKCPQGDDPRFGCQASSCTTYSPSQLLLCCATCAAQIPQEKTTERFILLQTSPTFIFIG